MATCDSSIQTRQQDAVGRTDKESELPPWRRAIRRYKRGSKALSVALTKNPALPPWQRRIRHYKRGSN